MNRRTRERAEGWRRWIRGEFGREERESARVEDKVAEKEKTRRTGRSLLRAVGGQIRCASGS